MNDQLSRAEGFFLLGMLTDAWEATEDLPSIDRIEPIVVELRLRILTERGDWELGGHLAGILIGSAINPKKCRETVARFHYRHACVLCETGENGAARLAIRAASEAWPCLRLEMINDKRLESALNGDH